MSVRKRAARRVEKMRLRYRLPFSSKRGKIAFPRTHTRWCGVKCARISARRREIGAKKQPDICRRPVVQVEEGRGGGGEVAVGEGGEEEEGGGTVAPRDQKQSSVQLLLHQARSCLPATLHVPVCLSHTQTTTITIHTIS